MLRKLFKKGIERDYAKILEERIDTMDKPCAARSQDHRLFINAYELGGFDYLHFQIIGPLNVKSITGGVVSFQAGENTLTAETDTEEIDSDHSSELGIGVTSFDLDFDETLKKFLNEHTIDLVAFNSRQGNVISSKSVGVKFIEIDQSVFKASLIPPPLEEEETGQTDSEEEE